MGLDVLLGWKSIGHLPCTTVPHPVRMHKIMMVEIHSYKQTRTVYVQSHQRCILTSLKKFYPKHKLKTLVPMD